MAQSEGEGKDTENRNDRPHRGFLLAAILFVLILVLVFGTQEGVGKRFGQPPMEQMELEELLARNAIEEVRFKENRAQITLRPGDLSKERESLNWTVNFNSQESAKRFEERIYELHETKKINTKLYAEHSNAFFYQFALYGLFVVLLVAVLYFFLFRQFRGPGSPGSLINFGKSRHKMAQDKTKITLADVAGVEEARQDIEEVIAFLKDPAKFSRLGGRIPKGVLLVGSPGTGKTLLAKATAGEADVPFYSVSGSDFVEMFVGVGASRVRDLFEKAKQTSPCIVFLDEVDAVGRRRGSGMGGGHDEREQTLNQILVEMDGFDTDRGIIVMAATNRPDILDPALLRPGRFDRQIHIGMPNVEAREKILSVHSRNKKLDPDVDLKTLARATPTFSGAELEALLNEAALGAAMTNKESITMHDLEEARDKIKWGRQKKSWKMVEAEVRATAYHEAGHAIVAALVEGCDPLHKVTVVPRGHALGMTMSLPEKDSYSLNKTQIEARICMAFGGRIGERMHTSDVSTGAGNDIEQATELARRMVTEWGMSEALGPIKYAADQNDTVFLGRELTRVKEFSDSTMKLIDDEVRRIVDEQYQRAVDLLYKQRDALGRVAEALMQYETISGDEVRSLIAGEPLSRQSTEQAETDAPDPEAESTVDQALPAGNVAEGQTEGQVP